MAMPALEFTNRVVLVTGAGSGIGAACAKLFTYYGATVTMADLSCENMLKTASCIEQIQCERESCAPEPLSVVMDMTKDNDVRNLVKRTIDKFKKLDVLVNCAGIMEFNSIEDVTMERYDKTMNLNLRSWVLLANVAVPHLIKSKGNIVSVSSVCGLRSFPNLLPYNMTKAAVDHFTRCVCLELGPKGVRINAVNPGLVITNLHKNGGMSEEDYKKTVERAKVTHALERASTPEEIAHPMCFLASDLASFITGVTLSVDGGRHAMCPR